MKESNKQVNNLDLVSVITTAIQIPGVKVDRELWLREAFKDMDKEQKDRIVADGPIEAGCDRKDLLRRARKLINERTIVSTGASFAAGLPGGLWMAATIPADVLQFYGVALRLAQELAYLYGEDDLWEGGEVNSEKVTNQLILYCGVMLGASGAAQTVRVMSSALAKQALKKLPQQALTKTFYYPIVKSIAKAFGVKMTKEIFAKGVSKALPVIGGVISGGITLATMRPMGLRLMNALDEAHFEYSEKTFEADWRDIVDECERMEDAEEKAKKHAGSDDNAHADENSKSTTVMEEIQQAKKLLDSGVISEEEFAQIKSKLIAKL